MSLDVYLRVDQAVERTGPRSGIFVREDGATREISREEWDRRNPDVEPVVCSAGDEPSFEVYSANITHNLGAMAAEAGIYAALWRPDENNIERAAQLVEPLKAGLDRLRAEPDRFRALNPANGWGSYDGLVLFVEGYLQACAAHPEAKVSVWR